MGSFDLCDILRENNPETRLYSWRKFNSFKQARLDYFLVSEEIKVDIKDTKIIPGYRSDHAIVTISINKNDFKKDKPFWKFNNSLLKDIKYADEIKKVITENKQRYALPVYIMENIDNIPTDELAFEISDQLFFETLLMEIRGKTISYASFKNKSFLKEEAELNDRIKILEENLTESNVSELDESKNRLREIREHRLEGVALRSKVRWINEGEKPSSYFCNLENRNYLDKAMHFLQRPNGETVSNQTDIIKEVQDFYSNLYKKKDVKDIDLQTVIKEAFKLNETDRKELEGPITYQEALKSLKAMKNRKSPGADGFTVEFFKFFFGDIGNFLVRSINEGFEKSQLSVTQRQGVIICIPKEGKPRQFIKNWRPISLLNVSYKIASSCIANRMKIVLHKIIDENQKGFLKGRYIGENIRLLYDTIVYTEKNNIPGMIVSIDFEKAFDSISWSFLQKSLEFFNFGPKFCQWIKTFYTDITSCISLNGQYSPWFPIERGVRQGDPCSPYLYLVCAEILSLFLKQNKDIKGIKIRDKETLLSQFADDTTLYLDGSEKSFNEVMFILAKFSEISGLKVNTEKTQITWIGRTKACGVKYMRDKNFIWDPGIFSMLGIKFSVDIDTIPKLNYQDKLLKMKRILSIWKRRHLTPLGKNNCY